MKIRRTMLLVDLKDRRVTAEEAILLLGKAVRLAELVEQSMESTLTVDDFLVWELKAIDPETLEATFYHGNRNRSDLRQYPILGMEFPVGLLRQRTIDIERDVAIEDSLAELNR